MKKLIFVLSLISTSAMAQAQATSSIAEQILQQSIGVCVGDNARAIQALREAQSKIAELEARLKQQEKRE